MVALEEADEIRGADDQRPVDQLHGPTLAAVRVRSPVTSVRSVCDRPDRLPPNPYQPAREKLIDRQIREAMNEGEFDDLPHQGEKLPIVEDSAAGDWALAYRMLKGASFAPPWIETDKEVRALLARRDAIIERAPRSSDIGRRRDERELRDVVTAANAAVFRLNHEAPTARQHRPLLDLDKELATLAAAHGLRQP